MQESGRSRGGSEAEAGVRDKDKVGGTGGGKWQRQWHEKGQRGNSRGVRHGQGQGKVVDKSKAKGKVRGEGKGKSCSMARACKTATGRARADHWNGRGQAQMKG